VMAYIKDRGELQSRSGGLKPPTTLEGDLEIASPWEKTRGISGRAVELLVHP
jgi:hypothetical protein